ncbi:hypothetical protein [Agromyces ramosus]|uniref:hypothetical protein n=1 Tax=Agromyces ramosus TaxID=33879 RepID=UPI0013EECD3C|nr:hypothetical protein [Agromyces ramosus]
MTDDRHNEQRFEFGLVPDSPETRLFVELSHFAGGDLSPAATALGLATEFYEREEADTAGFLVDSAVVAYCRAFVTSSVRGTRSLESHIATPAEFTALHQTIRTYRNTTVAHSQSELSMTWPLVVIDRSQGGKPTVWGPTLGQPLPWTIVEDFRRLVDRLLDLLHEMIEDLRVRLEADIRLMSGRTQIPAEAPFVAALDRDFTARTQRQPYPLRQTLYWSRTEARVEPDKGA